MRSQLNKDIDYCTRVLGCNAEQTDELIGAAEALTVNAEYFCEEFIVDETLLLEYMREAKSKLILKAAKMKERKL